MISCAISTSVASTLIKIKAKNQILGNHTVYSNKTAHLVETELDNTGLPGTPKAEQILFQTFQSQQ